MIATMRVSLSSLIFPRLPGAAYTIILRFSDFVVVRPSLSGFKRIPYNLEYRSRFASSIF